MSIQTEIISSTMDFKLRTTIILISGKAEAGKTTFANILHQRLGKLYCVVEKRSFARKVKESAYCMGWDGIKDEKGRKLLQDVGRAGRSYDKDLWVDHMLTDKSILPPDIIIVDDWRYMNELESIIDYGIYDVVTIRINRPSLDLSSEMYLDESETSLKEDLNYDFVITNFGTIEDLSKVDVILEFIKAL